MLSAAVCALAVSSTFADETVVVEEVIAESNAFDSVYGGLGLGGNFFKAKIKDLDNEKIASEKFNRFMGSAVLGAGKAYKGKYYIGAEFLVDFMKGKEKSFKDDAYDCTVKSNGFHPALALRFGYVFDNTNLVYGKFGGMWSKIKLNNKTTNESESKSKIAPTLALGFEKAFCKKFSVCVEPEYSFGYKAGKSKLNKGWNVRALVKYNLGY